MIVLVSQLEKEEQGIIQFIQGYAQTLCRSQKRKAWFRNPLSSSPDQLLLITTQKTWISILWENLIILVPFFFFSFNFCTEEVNEEELYRAFRSCFQCFQMMPWELCPAMPYPSFLMCSPWPRTVAVPNYCGFVKTGFRFLNPFTQVGL